MTFVPGETSKQITVNVVGDTKVEADEGFTLQLSYPRGGNLGIDTASALIRSDDTEPTVLISAGVAERTESEAATSPFVFTVHRIGDLSLAASVDYAVAGTGAFPADAADFGGSLPTGTIDFAPGETTKVIELAVKDDSDFENEEAFTVTLTNAENLAMDTASSMASILDDVTRN